MDSIDRPTYDIRQRPHFLIAVTGSEESEPPVRDVSAFLYDLNLLYEIARLATDPSYRHYTFSFRVWTRNNRPLSAQDQLIVHKLRLESPFDLSLLLPFVPKAVEAIRSVVGIAKELAGWRADTRIRSRPVRLQMDRQYGHRRQAGTASRGRFSHSEVVLLLRPPSGSCDAGRKHVLILVRFQDETNDPGPSGQTSQRLGIFRHPREASFKLTDDCLHLLENPVGKFLLAQLIPDMLLGVEF